MLSTAARDGHRNPPPAFCVPGFPVHAICLVRRRPQLWMAATLAMIPSTQSTRAIIATTKAANACPPPPTRGSAAMALLSHGLDDRPRLKNDPEAENAQNGHGHRRFGVGV